MLENKDILLAAVRKIVDGADLSEDESYASMTAIMSGEATDAQIAGFITALRMKGETVDEITGCARAMRDKATVVDPGESDYDVIDIVGTGGDVSGTFNISTAAAIVCAGAGVRVAKHGNRSVSSKSGSADVLKALGVNIEAEVPVVERCLREANIGYLFAVRMHAAMKHAIGPRRELAIRTVFNILGPLTNPARVPCQVLGVYDDALVPVMANVLKQLGSKRCICVHALEGMDEITTTGPTHIAELADGIVREYEIAPEDFGLPKATLDDLRVETPEESAEAIGALLGGETGPKRDVAALNAAAGIAVGGAAENLAAGLEMAQQAIDSGAALKTLDALVDISNSGA